MNKDELGSEEKLNYLTSYFLRNKEKWRPSFWATCYITLTFKIFTYVSPNNDDNLYLEGHDTKKERRSFWWGNCLCIFLFLFLFFICLSSYFLELKRIILPDTALISRLNAFIIHSLISANHHRKVWNQKEFAGNDSDVSSCIQRNSEGIPSTKKSPTPLPWKLFPIHMLEQGTILIQFKDKCCSVIYQKSIIPSQARLLFCLLILLKKTRA